MSLNDIKNFTKKLGKLTLSRLLFYSGFLALYLKIKNCLGSENEVLILRYHRIYDDNDQEKFYKLGINKTNFDKQMQYLTKNYHLLALEEAVRALNNGAPPPSNSIVITFDDGYKDNWINACSVLVKHKMPATIYLTTGYIGASNLFFWDRLKYIFTQSKLPQVEIPLLNSRTFDLSTPRRKKESFYQLLDLLKKVDDEVKNQIIKELESRLINGYPSKSKRDLLLSWEEVKKMSENGISFGGHTLTHPLLTKVPLEEAKFQIKKSKREIEKRLGPVVTSFAYPGGVLNEDIKKIVKESGYKSACSTFSGVNNRKTDLYALKRKGISDGVSTGLTGSFSKALFAVEVSGLFDKLFLRSSS